MKDHKNVIAKYSTARPKNKNLNTTQELFQDLVDTIRPFPPRADENFLMAINRVSSFLGIEDGEILEEEVCLPSTVEVTHPIGNSLPIQRKAVTGMIKLKKMVQAASLANKLIINQPKSSRTVTIIPDPNNSPPPGPSAYDLVVQEMENRSSPGGQEAYKDRLNNEAASAAEAAEAMAYFSQIPPLVSAGENNKQLNNGASVTALASLISANISFDGTGQGSDPASIIAISANDQLVALKKQQEAAATTRFEQIKPTILFVSEYILEGILNGTNDRTPRGHIVCWRKVPFAAGYVLKRVNVFTGAEVSYTIFNEELEDRMAEISSYVSRFVKLYDDTLYEVSAFLDDNVPPDNYFYYRLTAFQTYTENNLSIFTTAVSPVVHFNPTPNTNQLREFFAFPGPVLRQGLTAYQYLANNFLGDQAYDWILAGVNVRNSISNRDDRSVTRNYGYLEAPDVFMSGQINTGRFVLPKSVDVIVANILRSLNTAGVVAVLREILRDTGILYTFEGIDPAEDGDFSRPAIPLSESRFLGVLASAIDATNFILDLRTLITNLTQYMGGGLSDNKNSTGVATSSRAKPQEIELINNPKITDQDLSVQLGNLDRLVDLHTFEGISLMIHTIQVISSLGLSRTVTG